MYKNKVLLHQKNTNYNQSNGETQQGEFWEGPKPEASTVLSSWSQDTLLIHHIYV